jgi:hypothetical protein
LLLVKITVPRAIHTQLFLFLLSRLMSISTDPLEQISGVKASTNLWSRKRKSHDTKYHFRFRTFLSKQRVDDCADYAYQVTHARPRSHCKEVPHYEFSSRCTMNLRRNPENSDLLIGYYECIPAATALPIGSQLKELGQLLPNAGQVFASTIIPSTGFRTSLCMSLKCCGTQNFPVFPYYSEETSKLIARNSLAQTN